MTKTCKLKRVAEAGFAALLQGLLSSPVFSDKPFSSCLAPFTAGHILDFGK